MDITAVRDASDFVAEHPEPTLAHIEGGELPDEDVVVAGPRRHPPAERIVYLLLGLGLFVTALGLMKAGAAELIPALEGSIFTDNAWSTLGPRLARAPASCCRARRWPRRP